MIRNFEKELENYPQVRIYEKLNRKFMFKRRTEYSYNKLDIKYDIFEFKKFLFKKRWKKLSNAYCGIIFLSTIEECINFINAYVDPNIEIETYRNYE